MSNHQIRDALFEKYSLGRHIALEWHIPSPTPFALMALDE
jgi:hypothetical protein